MEHVVQTAVLRDHNAVAGRMPRSFDVIHAVGYLLALFKVRVRAVREIYRHHVGVLKFSRLAFLAGGVDRCIGESAQLAGVVRVLVRDQDPGDLLRLITERFESVHIRIDLAAHVYERLLVRNSVRYFRRHACVDQDDFRPGIDHKVLQAGAVLHRRIDPVHTFTAECERLGHKPVFIESDCADLHWSFIVVFHRLIPSHEIF